MGVYDGIIDGILDGVWDSIRICEGASVVTNFDVSKVCATVGFMVGNVVGLALGTQEVGGRE